MKKTIAIFLVVLMLVTFVSCSATEEDTSSISSTSDAVVSSPQFLEPETPDTVQSQEIVSVQTPQEDNSTSTIAEPDEVIFYKNGKYGSIKNKNKIYEIAKLVESWYKPYTQDTLPVCNWEYNAETIDEIKQKETVIEICYEDYTQIKMLNKIDHGKQRKIMIPLTGRYAYGVFLGKGEYDYTILLGELGDGGLEKYLKGITLDKDVRKWESTVIAPTTVTFYKDGMQSVSYDKEFNHKIAKHIESWFQYEDAIAGTKLAATTDLINENKRNEMAIELKFDGEIKFYGGVISKNTRTLFIPLTGKNDYLIFNNTFNYPDDWSGPKGTNGGAGLEKFFDDVKFTPLTEEEKRWRSTTNTPGSIEFYENGKLVGESGGYMQDYAFNNKVALHIESWFYKRENVETIAITDIPVETAWSDETYIKMWFDNTPAFYGEQIIDEKYSYVVIPLTGDYAYYIFVGTYDEMSDTAICAKGYDLEQFFDEIK